MRTRTGIAILLSASFLPPWPVVTANAQADLLCREASVGTPTDIRKEVYCMRRGGGFPPPFFPWDPARRSPIAPPRTPPVPPTTSASAFDRNLDGKLDCWKDLVGPMGRRSTTRLSSPHGPSQWRPGRWHYGADLVSGTANFGLGQPVRAMADGIVTEASQSSDNGNFVAISHNDGRVSLYLHLQKMLRTAGAVRAGDVIGTMNCTGRCGVEGRRNTVQSTHVHVELKAAPGVRRDAVNRLDPISYLGECKS